MQNTIRTILDENKRQLYGLILVLTAAFIGLFLLSQYSFLLAHAIAEMFSVAVALTIFFIAWNARSYFDNGYFVVLGLAYLSVSTVDLVHTVAYKGMGFFSEYGVNLPTQLWIFARYIESLSLAGALFFVSRRLRFYRLGFLVVLLVTGGGLTAIFLGAFPDCYLQGTGLTVFKKVSEYIIAVVLLGTLGGIYLLRHRFQKHVLPYLYVSLLLTILAGITFTGYVSVYGFSNMLGHYFKVISFYFIYRGVVVTGIRDPYALLMQRLQDRNRELEDSRDLIRRNQRISATMLNNIPEEIALLDAETLKIIDVNRTFLEGYGVTREQAIGSTCHIITHGSQDPCSGREHFCPLFTKQAERTPMVHTHRDSEGEIRYQEITVIPVEDEKWEEARRLVHISRDITERKRTEELREDIERVIRHDLKSPLNGIIGGTQLLLQNEEQDSEQKQLLNGIYNAGMSVLRMVNQSLDMYKMAEGSYELSPDFFNAVDMLHSLKGRWESQRTAKELSLHFSIEGQALENVERFFVYGEEQSLERLLGNLIENAIDASPHGGEITVSIGQAGDWVRFDVHNMGVVPEEVRERFFERYVTSGKRRGTGLGTYSAWLIVRTHGGRIFFTTDEGEGTHVTADIPSRMER